MVLPGVSEGVLPPNAEPVTSQEAMHHLAKQVGNQCDELSHSLSHCCPFALLIHWYIVHCMDIFTEDLFF